MNPTDDLVIESLTARRILDSRGFPTVEVRLTTDAGDSFVASAPSGASTGDHEAVELRDDGRAFNGRGVERAITSVNGEIAMALLGRPWFSSQAVDAAMIDLDGTGRFARLGANAVVAVSIATARAFAGVDGMPVHDWIAMTTGARQRIPVPHFNVLNGGAHAANDLDFQEFMIAPVGAEDMDEAVQTGSEVYHALQHLVRTRYGATGLGDEGGFAPPIADPRDALDLLMEAITATGHHAGADDVAIALDPAANGFAIDGGYRFNGAQRSTTELVDYYVALVDAYPIRSIEDGVSEHDIDGWQQLTAVLGTRIELVGDDLYVTDPARIDDGAAQHLSNAALIKPNQIGTVTQTLSAVEAARSNGMAAMISHRSGETLDPFIADLAVGTGVGRIKSGAPARGERVAKYNRLAEIARERPELPYGLA